MLWFVDMMSVSLNSDGADAALSALAMQQRRALLDELTTALPDPSKEAFWLAVQDPELPIEVLVRSFREALASGDATGQHRLFEQIILCIQTGCECWANNLLKTLAFPQRERSLQFSDLCADLYECVYRGLIDPQRYFWEENFWHCLLFERSHVFSAFLAREGWCFAQRVKHGIRVPRVLVESLETRRYYTDGLECLDVEDEQAREMFHAVEKSDLFQMVQILPEHFRAVIMLVFQEGKSEKETAQLLRITERTVRYRLDRALRKLRQLFEC